jgi:hypothetical protein
MKPKDKTNKMKESKGVKEVNEIIVNGQTEIEVERVEPKEKIKKIQKVSISYTLKSFGKNNDKLWEAKMITEEQYVRLTEIKNLAVEQYILSEY